MDEYEQTQLEQPTPQEKQPEEPEKKTESVTAARDKTRRNILHTVCGGYLAYLSYKMFRSFLELIASEGWSGGRGGDAIRRADGAGRPPPPGRRGERRRVCGILPCRTRQRAAGVCRTPDARRGAAAARGASVTGLFIIMSTAFSCRFCTKNSEKT